MRPSGEAFDVASYGKRLGLITERLRDLSRRGDGFERLAARLRPLLGAPPSR